MFWCYFVFTLLTSGLKVRLPTVFATLSVNFLSILMGIVLFSLPEAILLGVAGTIVQCLWRPRVRPKTIQIAFSACSIGLAVATAHSVFHGPLNGILADLNPLLLGAAACSYFVVNTVLIAGVIALTERKSIVRTWYQTYFWILPYHLAAASVAWLIVVLTHQNEWHAALVLLPLVYFVYRSYKMYLDRLEKDKSHVEEIAGLHLRTIEALALAIEAKDTTTADHLARVRVYATEIGKEIGLSQNELDALQAAALLHDIGKLAVPEHIISKPGRLTPEEFDKMKIHPLIGAEILEEVKFPYPVVPIVRAHHEKWDGSGYPFGLAGEEIPIGRAHSFGGGLPRRAGVGPAVPPGFTARSGDGNRQFRIGQELRSGDRGHPAAALYRTGAVGAQHRRGEGADQAFDGRQSGAWTRARHRFRRDGRRTRSRRRRPRSIRCLPSPRPRRKRRCCTN